MLLFWVCEWFWIFVFLNFEEIFRNICMYVVYKIEIFEVLFLGCFDELMMILIYDVDIICFMFV